MYVGQPWVALPGSSDRCKSVVSHALWGHSVLRASWLLAGGGLLLFFSALMVFHPWQMRNRSTRGQAFPEARGQAESVESRYRLTRELVWCDRILLANASHMQPRFTMWEKTGSMCQREKWQSRQAVGRGTRRTLIGAFNVMNVLLAFSFLFHWSYREESMRWIILKTLLLA